MTALTDRQFELLGGLCGYSADAEKVKADPTAYGYPADFLTNDDWRGYLWQLETARPMDVGGWNGSHHSNTLRQLAIKGLVLRGSYRRFQTPERLRAGPKVKGSRGSYRYQITEAGTEAYRVERERRSSSVSATPTEDDDE